MRARRNPLAPAGAASCWLLCLSGPVMADAGQSESQRLVDFADRYYAAVLERTPELPYFTGIEVEQHDGLLVASSSELGFRSAAALARARNRSIYLFISEAAEERSTLVALRKRREEFPSGRDS